MKTRNVISALLLSGMALFATAARMTAQSWSPWVTVTGIGGNPTATMQLLVKHDGTWRADTQYGAADFDKFQAFGCKQDGAAVTNLIAYTLFRRAASALVTARDLSQDPENLESYCPFVPINASCYQYTVNGSTYNYVVPYDSPDGWHGDLYVWRSVTDNIMKWPGVAWRGLGVWPLLPYDNQDRRVQLYKDALTSAVYQLDRNYRVNRENEWLETLNKYLEQMEPVAFINDLPKSATDDLAEGFRALRVLGEVGTQNGPTMSAQGIKELSDKVKKIDVTLKDSTVLNIIRNHLSSERIDQINKITGVLSLGMKVLDGCFKGYDMMKHVSNYFLFDSLYGTLTHLPQVEERIEALDALSRTEIIANYDPALALAIDGVIADFYRRKSGLATFEPPPEVSEEFWNAVGTGAKLSYDLLKDKLTGDALTALAITPGVGTAIMLGIAIDEAIGGFFNTWNDSEQLLVGNANLSLDRWLSREIKKLANETGRDYRLGARSLSYDKLTRQCCYSSMASYAAYRAIDARIKTFGSGMFFGDIAYNFMGLDTDQHKSVLENIKSGYLGAPADWPAFDYVDLFQNNTLAAGNRVGDAPLKAPGNFGSGDWSDWFSPSAVETLQALVNDPNFPAVDGGATADIACQRIQNDTFAFPLTVAGDDTLGYGAHMHVFGGTIASTAVPPGMVVSYYNDLGTPVGLTNQPTICEFNHTPSGGAAESPGIQVAPQITVQWNSNLGAPAVKCRAWAYDAKWPSSDYPGSPKPLRIARAPYDRINAPDYSKHDVDPTFHFTDYACYTFKFSPGTPSGLWTSVASATQIQLGWAGAGDEDGFKLERAEENGPFRQIASLQGASFTDSGALCTHYRYRVRAYNVGGYSDYSNTNAARTGCTLTWSGVANPDITWQNAGNWSGCSPLQTGDSLLFDSRTVLRSLSDFPNGLQIGAITFGANAGAFVLSGSPIQLNGDVVNHTANNQTLALPISLAKAGQRFDTGPGSLTLNSSISCSPLPWDTTFVKTGAGTLLVTSNASIPGIDLQQGTVRIEGGVPAYRALVTAQAGTLCIMSNAYCARVTLQDATLEYHGTNAFPTGLRVQGASTLFVDSQMDLPDWGFQGTGALVKTGAGMLSLASRYDFSGPLTVQEGGLQVGFVPRQMPSLPLEPPAGQILLNTGTTLRIGGDTGENLLSNSISGRGDVIIDASPMSQVTLAGSNDGFYGNLVVKGGELRPGRNAAFGSPDGGLFVGTNGTLNVCGYDLGAEPVTVQGQGRDPGDWGGAIVNNSGFPGGGLRFLTLAGDTALGGWTNWSVGGDGGWLRGNGYNLRKKGVAEIQLLGLGETALADIGVENGALIFEGSTTLGNPDAFLRVNNNGQVVFRQTGTNLLRKRIEFLGSPLSAPALKCEGSLTAFSGDVFFENLTLISVDGSLDLAGTLRGSGISKSGPGSLVVTATNLLDMHADVREGTLQFGNGGALGAPNPNLPLMLVFPSAYLVFNLSTDFDYPGSITTPWYYAAGTVCHVGTGTLSLQHVSDGGVGLPPGRMCLAVGAAAPGVATLTFPSDARINAAQLEVGSQAGRNGRVLQEAGAMVTATNLSIGVAAGQASFYFFGHNPTNQTRPASLLISGQTAIGGLGRGSFVHESSIARFDQIFLGAQGPDGVSVYDLRNGMLGIGPGGITGAGGNAALRLSGNASIAAWADCAITVTNILTGEAGNAIFDTGWPAGSPFHVTVSGPVVGPGGLTKTNAGELLLNASNSFLGPLVIGGGSVTLGNPAALARSSAVEFGLAQWGSPDLPTLNVSGLTNPFCILPGQSLRGGPGLVQGSLSVQGTLMPGHPADPPEDWRPSTINVAGDLQLSGSVVLPKVVADSPGGGAISASGTITYGGLLVVTSVVRPSQPPGLLQGCTVKLFQAAAYAGSFSRIDLPPLDDGLFWDTSGLTVEGTITATQIPAPRIENLFSTGPQLGLRVESFAGLTYVLQSSTNLSASGPWVDVSTNGGAGLPLIIPLPFDVRDGTRFFRLHVR